MTNLNSFQSCRKARFRDNTNKDMNDFPVEAIPPNVHYLQLKSKSFTDKDVKVYQSWLLRVHMLLQLVKPSSSF